MLFKNTDNRAIILKIYEKLNKLETDFADMKKGQSGMETDIKKIKNEICLLTNDKEFMEVNYYFINSLMKFEVL
jgi:hypothetical protein